MPVVKRKERVPRKREGPQRNERGPCVSPLRLTLSSPTKLVSRVPSPTLLLSIHTTPTLPLPRIGCISTCVSVCVCVSASGFAAVGGAFILMEDTAWLSCKREKEWKRGWSARLRGEGDCRACWRCMRARGGVLAATRVVEREISRKREETKKREVTSLQGP